MPDAQFREEEGRLAKDFILLPIVLDVLEWDARIMSCSSLKMAKIYIDLLRHMQDQASNDLVNVRRSMRLHSIKVYEQKRTEIGVEAKYLSRGYHRNFTMLWGNVRAEVEVLLKGYVETLIPHRTNYP